MKRILIIRIDFLGDLVCTTALIRSIKQRWPAAELHVLANRDNQEVLLNNPDVTQCHTYVYSKHRERNRRPGRLATLVDRWELIWRLRRLHVDLLVIPNGGMHKNSIQFARQLNARDNRWHDAETGFDDRNPVHVANRALRHEALSGYALMPELGHINIDALRLQLYPVPDIRARWQTFFGNRTRPRIGLFISNKSSRRRWPIEKWRQLAATLSPQGEVFVFHHPTELPMTPIAARSLVTPSVKELVAAMSLLDLVISADSAPVHISSALQIPVVALFEARPEKYRRWYPLVRHELLYAGPEVASIPVEAVVAAVHRLVLSTEEVK
ncbi:Sugar transferase [Enterobacterales bacterium 8AC]|nr:Sugar transferase [Enterobacterales bacterium 8AC]